MAMVGRIVFIVLFSLISLVLVTMSVAALQHRQWYLFDHTISIVATPSMEPAYPTRSLVVLRKVQMKELVLGDVISFQLDNQVMMHRIIEIREEGVITKGDRNAYPDQVLVTGDMIIGKATFKTDFHVRLFRLITTVRGFISYVLLPLIIIISAKILYQRLKRSNP